MNKPEEINEPKEMLDEEVVEQSEMVETEPTTCDCDNDNPESDQGGKCCRRWHCIARLIFDLLMLAAVITLFVLYGKTNVREVRRPQWCRKPSRLFPATEISSM